MPPSSRRRLALGVALVIVPGVGTGLIVGLALHAASVHASLWYCVAIAVLVLALFRISRVAIDDLEVPERIRRGSPPVADDQPEFLALLERRLSGAAREQRLFVTGLQPILRDVLAERLKLHHDIDFDRARQLLGDELWHWMTTREHDGPAPTGQQLERMITAIESL